MQKKLQFLLIFPEAVYTRNFFLAWLWYIFSQVLTIEKDCNQIICKNWSRWYPHGHLFIELLLPKQNNSVLATFLASILNKIKLFPLIPNFQSFQPKWKCVENFYFSKWNFNLNLEKTTLKFCVRERGRKHLKSFPENSLGVPHLNYLPPWGSQIAPS